MKKVLSLMAVLLFLAFPIHATVTDTESPVKVYTSATVTAYPIPFDYIDDEDIEVTLVAIATSVETAQTLNVDYTIVSDTVTYSTAPGAAYKVVIRRVTPYTQEASWVAGSAPPLSAWESAFDKLTYLTQELNERLLRAPLTPSDSSVSSPTMPDPARYPGQYIRINSGGTNYEAIDLSGTLGAINITVLSDYADFNTMVSTIGTTEKTVFIDTVGALSADITIPSTMHLIVLKGGIITLGNYDLTINGPFDAGRFQVFNCSGTGAVSGLSTAYPEWWGFGESSSAAINTSALNAAISSTAAGATVRISATTGQYTINDDIIVAAAKTIEGEGYASKIYQSGTDKHGFIVTASNVAFRNLRITGRQYATSADEYAIYAHGTDSSHYLSGIKVENCFIDTWGFYGVHLEFVENFILNKIKIDDIYYGAILTLSCRYGDIGEIDIDNVVATPNAYGIEATRAQNDSLVTYPRSADINIHDFRISNVTNWKAVGTHGGQRINIHDGIIYGCVHGVGIGSCPGTAGTAMYAPLDCHVSNVIIDSGVTDGTAQYGVFFVGAYASGVVEYATGSVSNCRVYNFGDESASLGAAVYSHTVDGFSIDNVDIVNAGRIGYLMGNDAVNFTINGGNIIDVWSNTIASPTGVYITATGNTGRIDGVNFGTSSKSATYKNNTAIYVYNGAGNSVTVGDNDSICPVYLNDSGFKTIRGNPDSVVSSGTGEDTLATQTLPANRLGIGKRIRVVVSGTKTGSNGNKTIKLYFGSTFWTFNAAANDVTDWRCEADIICDTTASQKISWIGHNGVTVTQGYEDAGEDMTAAITLKVTGECANASDVITQKFMDIRID